MDQLLHSIAEQTVGLSGPLQISPVGGGDINEAYALRGAEDGVFIKLNRRAVGTMFATEFEALRELAATTTVNVPAPLGFGERDGVAYLVLELLEFGPRTDATDAALGAQLAALHRIEQAFFGWHRDNFIGRTPQTNSRDSDWLRFFADNRLRFQVDRLLRRTVVPGLEEELGRLIGCLPDLFADYRPSASLVHGDLWGGNYRALEDGGAVIFDPASYYGCRETDLAMTELFGGFGTGFYRAYEAAWPLDSGYQARKPLYQLYHVLNHANLFGGGYLVQAQQLMARIINQGWVDKHV